MDWKRTNRSLLFHYYSYLPRIKQICNFTVFFVDIIWLDADNGNASDMLMKAMAFEKALAAENPKMKL